MLPRFTLLPSSTKLATSSVLMRRFVSSSSSPSSLKSANHSVSVLAFLNSPKRFIKAPSSSKPSEQEEDFMSAIDQRLDVLERVVSNLVANMTEQQKQQELGSMTATTVKPDSSLVVASNSHNNSNHHNNRSVVAPSAMRSVVKVYSTIVAPNAIQPWQVKSLTTATGTAFIVDRKRKLVLTNAHVVAYASLIEVRRHGQARRCVAECKFISGDCDLALLEIQENAFWEEAAVAGESPDFFSGLTLDGEGNDNSQGDSSSSSSASTKVAPSLESISKIDVFQGFPSLQQNVSVVGFPLGGDQVSITSGVVSRIDQTPYSTSGLRIAAIQIDAAINPGNSGGPALCDGRVVGVAFQSLMQAEGIGYIIPNCVVAHFVRSYLALNEASSASSSSSSSSLPTTTTTTTKSVSGSKFHEGFPSVGLYYQELGNPTLRENFRLPTEANGFLVEKLIGGSPNADKLKAGDIIMKVDGNQIERDITIEWRPNERIQFTHLIHMRNPGDKMVFAVWRNKKEIEVEVIVRVPTPLVRPHLLHPSLNQKPPYIMFAGCVFTILSVPYLEAWGANWPSNAPRALVNQFLYGEISDSRNEIVVLAQILPHAVNRGYSSDSFAHRNVETVNGKSVKNFAHFVELLNEAINVTVEDAKSEDDDDDNNSSNNKNNNHVILGLKDSAFPLTMVLPRKDALEADLLLTNQHGIPESCLAASKKSL